MFPLKDNIPTENFPVVTVALIVVNVLAYFFFQHGTITLGDPGNAAYVHNLWDYAYIPRELTDGVQCQPAGAFVRCTHENSGLPALYITVFTSLFMHGGLLHLGGNMLFLWIFGNNVEDSMGPVKFVVFYLLAGLAATAGQTLVAAHSAVPNIGASGAIAGVLGGYLVLFPRARVVTVIFIIFFFTILELPAVLFLVHLVRRSRSLFGTSDSRRGRATAAGWRTSRTSVASRSGCWRSSCSPANEGAASRSNG